jgi:hypothetical protein
MKKEEEDEIFEEIKDALDAFIKKDLRYIRIIMLINAIV